VWAQGVPVTEHHTGDNKVFCSWHDETQVSMSTPAACGRDGSCIGIEFLGKVLEHGVVRCANNGGQLGMREHECGCG